MFCSNKMHPKHTCYLLFNGYMILLPHVPRRIQLVVSFYELISLPVIRISFQRKRNLSEVELTCRSKRVQF